MNFVQRTVAALAVTMLVASGAIAAEQKSLYERLGGKAAITAVVNELWAVVSVDARINGRFRYTKPEIFGAQLVDFLCQASGGPCQYAGRDMKSAHTGMKLTDDEFTALAEDTVKALNKFNVPATEHGEVMNMLGSLKGDVVNR